MWDVLCIFIQTSFCFKICLPDWFLFIKAGKFSKIVAIVNLIMEKHISLYLVAFLLTNLHPVFAIKNEISRFIYGQTNLRLQCKQSTSGGGSFTLVTETKIQTI